MTCPSAPPPKCNSLVQASPCPRKRDLPIGAPNMIDLTVISEPEMSLPSDASLLRAVDREYDLANFMPSQENCYSLTCVDFLFITLFHISLNMKLRP